MSRSKSAKLPSLVEPDAGDVELLGMVVGHYAEALAGHQDAMAFLARRRIGDPEALDAFRIGFADRTLGYRIPHSRTSEGDPAAVAAICGHWLAASAGSAHELAHRVDQAHQVLAHAAATDVRPSSS